MAFTHPIVTLPLAALFFDRTVPARIWWWSALLTALPDIDFIGWQLGVPYGHPFGHRGFTHSLVFAALMALFSTLYLREGAGLKPAALWLFLFLCGASHGFLDGMTNGGLGVAYLAPFDNARYWMPWRPIPVAPLHPRNIFGAWGLRVFEHELIYLWVPCVLIALSVVAVRWPKLRHDSDSVR